MVLLVPHNTTEVATTAMTQTDAYIFATVFVGLPFVLVVILFGSVLINKITTKSYKK